MFVIETLSQKERDRLLDLLNNKQREFVSSYLKRGRRTVFANVLAKEKAGSDAEGHIAEKWELEDYLDAGPRWQSDSELHCECGRRLRYQYIVKNLETGEIKKFGIQHFEEHTGIPPKLAKEIVNGIERIDYEMDEVLVKLSRNWSLRDEGIEEMPSTITIPKDIKEHFDYDVPLLSRQVRRLKERIAESYSEKRRIKLENLEKERQKNNRRKQEEIAKRRNEVAAEVEWGNFEGIALERDLQLGILVYLDTINSPKIRATDVCKELIENHGASRETYSSGKPRIFSNVCIFLERLVQEGKLELVEKQGVEDRIYKIVDRP